MTYLIIKAALSGIIIMIVSEVSRRNPSIGGLIGSLPLISILAFIWLWRDTSDTERIAAQAEATFWYVFPSIPMFLALPAMLRNGVGFWAALTLSCALTVALYSATMWLLPRIGSISRALAARWGAKIARFPLPLVRRGIGHSLTAKNGDIHRTSNH
jgi:uncharacterized membrane protein (GlpM family)